MEKVKQQYILSPFYTLPSFEAIYKVEKGEESSFHASPDYNKLRDKELYLLKELSRDKLFFINPTTFFFLNAFSQASTLETVILKFAKEANCAPDEITAYLENFLDQMLRRDIIVMKEQHGVLNQTAQMILQEEESIPNFSPGNTLGEYIVEQVLSIRAKSQLYLMKKEQDADPKYVLKATFLHPDMPDEVKQNIKLDFKKEFDLMKELGAHASICGLVEYTEEQNICYAVLEYIDGTSLYHFIKKNEIPLHKKLDVIGEAFAVIAHIQDRGILHGDIHNDNFLIDKNDKVKLIDFGLSNHDEPDPDEILRNGGKSGFIPPERVSLNSFKFLEQRADHASEVFQLAVLAFYVLYEKMPFRGFSWRELATNIKTVDPVLEKVTPQNEAIPEDLIEMLKIALDKSPEKRFQTARDMLKAFNIVAA